MAAKDSVVFQKRDFQGSRLRCLLLTHRERRDVAKFLTDLSEKKAVVDSARHKWGPNGFLSPKEIQLGESDLVDEKQRGTIEQWWLANPQDANTPNWDIVSQA